MNKKSNNKGFSLVELIIVIAIMAILVGVLAPQFIKYIESSRQSTDIQNASSIRSAIEAYVAETDPTPAGPITVSIDGDHIKVAGDTGIGTALGLVGLSDDMECKSGGWPDTANVGSYDCTTFKWAQVTCTNGNQPAKDLSAAFK